MEDSGCYAIFVAECDDKIIGYMSIAFYESPHIIGYIQGMQDSLFVERAYRTTNAAELLIKEAEKYAVEIGCSALTIGFKHKNPHIKFCQSMGYEPDDVMCTKILEGGV